LGYLQLKCALRVCSPVFNTQIPQSRYSLLVRPNTRHTLRHGHWPRPRPPLFPRLIDFPAKPGVQPFYNSGPYNNNRTMTMSFGRDLPSVQCSPASKLLTKWLITNREEGFSFQPTHILSACINVPRDLTFPSSLLLRRWKISALELILLERPVKEQVIPSVADGAKLFRTMHSNPSFMSVPLAPRFLVQISPVYRNHLYANARHMHIDPGKRLLVNENKYIKALFPSIG